MKYIIEIIRRENALDMERKEVFECEYSKKLTVADFLNELNSRCQIRCEDGTLTTPVTWECACMEGKCGACAMLINGRPGLACSSFIDKVADRKGRVLLEPLSKFPLVKDLKVDRRAIFDMLVEMRLWTDEKRTTPGEDRYSEYQSSRCLMCGCCLEVCPNYIWGEEFSGAAALVNAYKSLEQNEENPHLTEMKLSYLTHFFNGCSVSLSCKNVCPAGIPIDQIQSRANARALHCKRR